MEKTVQLTFRPASDPPDDDTTVLCVFASEDGSPEDVASGWRDGDDWFDCTGLACNVLAWAHLPDAMECVPE